MIIKIKNVRIAFCQNLHKAGVMTAGDAPKYSSTFLIPKNDPQVQAVNAAIRQVAIEKWGQKTDAVLKSLGADKICMRDGDTKEQYDGFAGHMFISASGKDKPTVFDVDKVELVESSGKPYAGCYVNASVDIWAQDNQYGKRINAKLRAVQFVRDGDAFVGAAPATEDEFDDLFVDAPAGNAADPAGYL